MERKRFQPWHEARLLLFKRNSGEYQQDRFQFIQRAADSIGQDKLSENVVEQLQSFLNIEEQNFEMINNATKRIGRMKTYFQDMLDQHDGKIKKVLKRTFSKALKRVGALEEQLEHINDQLRGTGALLQRELQSLQQEMDQFTEEVLQTHSENYLELYGIHATYSGDGNAEGMYQGTPVRLQLSDLHQVTAVEARLPRQNVSIQFSRPATFEVFSAIMRNAQNVLAFLQRNPRFRRSLPRDIQLQYMGSARFDTMLTVNGREQKYCITPNGIYKVVEEATEEQKQRSKECHIILSALYSQQRELRSLNQKKLKTLLSGGLRNRKTYNRILADNEKAIEELRKKHNLEELDRAVHNRTLENERGEIIREDIMNQHIYVYCEVFRDNGTIAIIQKWVDAGLQSETHYNEEGKQKTEVEYYPLSSKLKKVTETSSKGKETMVTKYDEDGSYTRSDNVRNRLDGFDSDGTWLYGKEFDPKTNDVKRHYLADKTGREFGTFTTTNDLRKQEGLPTFTYGEFMLYLATHLDTLKKKRVLIEQLYQYAYDTDNLSKPRKIVEKGKSKDYWQVGYETLSREEIGKNGERVMRGDCEDIAGLINLINKLQGLTSFLMYIGGMGPMEVRDDGTKYQGGHAVCFWVKPGTNGKTLCSAGTFGVFEETGETTEEAMLKHLERYRDSNWMDGYVFDPQNTKFMFAQEPGKKHFYQSNLDAFTEFPERHTSLLLTLSRELHNGMKLHAPYAKNLLAKIDAEVQSTMKVLSTGKESQTTIERKVLARTNAELRAMGYEAEWKTKNPHTLMVTKLKNNGIINWFQADQIYLAPYL